MTLFFDHAWIGVLWAASAGIYLSLVMEGVDE